MTSSKPHPVEENPIRSLAPFRVDMGAGFDWSDHPTSLAETGGIDKATAKTLLTAEVARLGAYQERLYAAGTYSVLIVFQGMDASGKDSMIKNVMSGVNPQGVSVTSFKAPGPEALSHDFLWRVSQALPARGMIGVFNRSHYEEAVITRVHPALLERQGLPVHLRGDPALWAHRLEDIACFERYLTRQGVVVLKFFLHISKQEQKDRLLKRLDDPAKHWKFDPADLEERGHWDDYMSAYGHAIAATATPDTPWFVIPADQKWLARLVVVQAINETLSRLYLEIPAPTEAETRDLDAARDRLRHDG